MENFEWYGKYYFVCLRRRVNGCNIERKECGICKIENLIWVKNRLLYVLLNVRRGVNVDSDCYFVKVGLKVKLIKIGLWMVGRLWFYIEKIEEIDCVLFEEDILGISRYGRWWRSFS